MEPKLCLEDEMKDTFLIQRLGKPINFVNPFSFGGGLVNGGLTQEASELLSNIFSFDYMGAAEFEWGVVPEALNFMARQAEDGTLISGEIDSVLYICPESYEEEVTIRIQKLLEDEWENFRLKAYCGLKDRIEKQDGNIVGWLELNNGFLFFIDKKMFEATKHLFGIAK